MKVSSKSDKSFPRYCPRPKKAEKVELFSHPLDSSTRTDPDETREGTGDSVEIENNER